MNLDVLRLAIEGKRKEWEQQHTNNENQIQKIGEKVERLQQKRRLYSWQHAEGIISDKELLDANKGIRLEVDLLDKQLGNLQQFLVEPAPPDPTKIDKWLEEWWPAIVAAHCQDADDEVKAKFADVFDLTVTIFPGDSPQSYRLQLTANIPLDVQGIEESADSLEMVFASPW